MVTAQTKQLQRWFRVALAAGAVLALVVLVNSVTNYAFVSRRIIIEQLRREMTRTAVALDTRLAQNPAIDASQLTALLSDAKAASNNIAWIRAQTRDGKLTARTGASAPIIFNDDAVHTILRSREPATRTVEVNGDEAVVELIPVRLAGGPGHLEIASWMEGASGPLWPVRRNLIINSSVAVALLLCLAIMGLRFRSWLRGRELEDELELAKSVQDALLPAREQRLGRVNVASECVPFGGVGGDLHDVFETEDGNIAIVAGDVSGKGLPAALLMGVIHGAVRSGNWYESAAAHVDATERLNRLLCERAGNSRFASLVWASYDVNGSKLRYINAGHCRPLLVRSSGEVCLLDDGGPVLGLLPFVLYSAAEVGIGEGDTVVLYSDGLAEAANDQDEEFGEERIIEAIQRCAAHTAEGLRSAVVSAVRKFTGRTSLSDDLTLVVARFESEKHVEFVPRRDSHRLAIVSR